MNPEDERGIWGKKPKSLFGSEKSLLGQRAGTGGPVRIFWSLTGGMTRP